MSQSTTIVQRLWNYCNVLRDDGMSYCDYLDQLTYLLFLKMDDERARELGAPSAIPAEYNWASLTRLDGEALESHYREALANLGRGSGLIPVIFRKAQNKVQDPAKLRRLVTLIDGETWIGLGIDVKSDIYEGLLEKNAQDVKTGAGQYFTPRPLIKAMVDVMRPAPGQRICDPAGGTGGFLLAAYDYIREHHALDRDQRQHLTHDALHGWEIVDSAARLCVMNLYLHGIGADAQASPIRVDDSLAADPGDRFDMVLTNPPFGKKSSVTYITETGETKREAQTVVRDDFWTSTSNKQLNFVQHVMSILKPGGRAAVVVPDNVLFADQAGEVFKILTEDCDLHTVLRLPNGTFTPYSPGTKTNVIFFTKGFRTEKVWIYDARTNVPGITKKDRPLTPQYFAEFELCYGKNPEGHSKRDPRQAKEDRWRSFSINEVKARDFKIDSLKWLKDESLNDGDELPEPEELAAEAISELQSAIEDLNLILLALENSNGESQRQGKKNG